MEQELLAAFWVQCLARLVLDVHGKVLELGPQAERANRRIICAQVLAKIRSLEKAKNFKSID